MKNRSPIQWNMQYVKDPLGQEMLLRDGTFQVMMEWEKPYMQACIDALQPQGHVLEIGFGCGYSATHIQTYGPKSHTIIECHPMVAARAREWAKNYLNVTIIENTWQHALSHLDVFDCVFFDDYPLETVQGASLVPSISYSGEDIDVFIDQLKKDNISVQSIYHILRQLKDRKQITDDLFDKAAQKIVDEKVEELLNGPTIITKEKISQLALYRGNERLMQFLCQCIPHHMKKHSRFSCYLNDPLCTWENPDFFQNIIANPDVDYRETEIYVEVPEHCKYYKKDRALVIVIEKMVENLA